MYKLSAALGVTGAALQLAQAHHAVHALVVEVAEGGKLAQRGRGGVGDARHD